MHCIVSNMHQGHDMRKLTSSSFNNGISRENNPNLYVKNNEYENIVLISLYLDDLIITGSAINLIEETKGDLS